ncbi:sigma-70 family RNA polymerase sigma factor [Streptomyces amakusaensis]|uniref:Sigma-70 family RNA polymerase sigma factor n=1 Tax=Streptomyces amakusaensis TaxID=67271 RepID=A0ABW0ATI1_9ACTN
MSIVAERVAGVGAASRPVWAGLAEEIERQERENEGEGPTYEPDEPEGRLGDRVGGLFVLHHDRLVRHVAWRLGVERAGLAEDLVQQMWVELLRRPAVMETWAGPDESFFGLLAYRARQALYAYWGVRRNSNEQPLGAGRAGDERSVAERLDVLAGPGPDATVCAVLELLDPGTDADEGVWSACWDQALGALPARQREVVELRCVEGMTTYAIAARLGISQPNVMHHLGAALAVLRDPAEVRARLERRERVRLPQGWERVVGRLPAGQGEVVRLRVSGWSHGRIGERLGVSRATVQNWENAAARSLREMVADQRLDPVTAAPVAPAGRVCAARCAGGCYLRGSAPAGTEAGA